MTEDRFTNTERDAGRFEAQRGGNSRVEWAKEHGYDPQDNSLVPDPRPIPQEVKDMVEEAYRRAREACSGCA